MGPVYYESPSLCDCAWTQRAVNWHEDQDPKCLERSQVSGFSVLKCGGFALRQVSWARTVSQSSCPCMVPGAHGPQRHFTEDYGRGSEAAAYSLIQYPVRAHATHFPAGSLGWCRQLLPDPLSASQAPGPGTCLAPWRRVLASPGGHIHHQSWSIEDGDSSAWVPVHSPRLPFMPTGPSLSLFPSLNIQIFSSDCLVCWLQAPAPGTETSFHIAQGPTPLINPYNCLQVLLLWSDPDWYTKSPWCHLWQP